MDAVRYGTVYLLPGLHRDETRTGDRWRRCTKTIRWVIPGSRLFKTCFGGNRAVKKVARFLCRAPKRLPSRRWARRHSIPFPCPRSRRGAPAADRFSAFPTMTAFNLSTSSSGRHLVRGLFWHSHESGEPLRIQSWRRYP
jgi:hypothetical protein